MARDWLREMLRYYFVTFMIPVQWLDDLLYTIYIYIYIVFREILIDVK